MATIYMSCIPLSKKDDSKVIEVVDNMRALSNYSSILLCIAISDGRSGLLSKLNTRKQFNSGISSLRECGLVERKNGKYVLTFFGRIVYSVKMALLCHFNSE
jgi:hypothetical protein